MDEGARPGGPRGRRLRLHAGATRDRDPGRAGLAAGAACAARRARPGRRRSHRGRAGPRGPAPWRERQRAGRVLAVRLVRDHLPAHRRGRRPDLGHRLERRAAPRVVVAGGARARRVRRAYLDQVERAVDLFERRGVYTIIDFHQDAWGPTLAAPAGTTCPAGSDPAFGWDGAPGWATLDGGASRCAPGGVREISPAVLAAFAAFWNDAPGPGRRRDSDPVHTDARSRRARASRATRPSPATTS